MYGRIGTICAIMPENGKVTLMAEEELPKTMPLAAYPKPDEVAALMNAAIAAARAEGVAVPPDLARKTFAVTRKLARRRNAE